jgi:hypothetical protein
VNVRPDIRVGSLYGGGAVFYILVSGDPGYDANVQHGLILAPIGLGYMNWNTDNRVTGATGTALGTGASNTNAIIASQGGALTNSAAGLARAYNGGGYTDWYLPSQNELHQLFINQVAIGATPTAYPSAYMSSTELDGTFFWSEDFYGGGQNYTAKSDDFRIRAVRSF